MRQNNGPASAGGKGSGQGSDRPEDWRKVVLDEKYFRRIDKFEGDFGKFRGWLFDLLVAVGQVDDRLGKEIKNIIGRGLDEK